MQRFPIGLLTAALAWGSMVALWFDPLDPETLLLVYLPPGVTLIDAFVPRYCAGRSRSTYEELVRLLGSFAPDPASVDRALDRVLTHHLVEHAFDDIESLLQELRERSVPATRPLGAAGRLSFRRLLGFARPRCA